MSTFLRKERHSISDLKVPLVFVTKYRCRILTVESLKLIEKSFEEVAKKMNFQVLEFNGAPDPIYVLI